MKLRLSSKDILNKKFKQSANGYDPEEVDTFWIKFLKIIVVSIKKLMD